MIRGKTLLFSFTEKWIKRKEKVNVNCKIVSISFSIVLIRSKERVFPKASRVTVIFHLIFKKIFR